MFQNIEPAPADPILGLTEAFNADTRANKINLGVGVYKSNEGVTPVLDCVTEAQKQILATEKTKAYKPMAGDPAYGKAVQALMFGSDHEVVTSGRAATAHTPGGTGALRVAGEYITSQHPDATLWVSDPTWANHGNIFSAAGLKTKSYPYFDKASNSLDFDAMINAIKQIPAGDAILLHGCCHNPTGVDPSDEQWSQIADVVAERGILPLLDFAYQGFGQGLTEDSQGLLALARPGSELLVCSSFSKNFGLYNERTGSLTLVAANKENAQAAFSHVKAVIRRSYSNPPAHGGAIVTTILNDAALKTQWVQELTDMRNRINTMRSLFVSTLSAKGIDQDFSFITRQQGMFSFSGLNKDHVQALKEKHAVYIVGSGRINVAGMTEANMDALCEAIKDVL